IALSTNPDRLCFGFGECDGNWRVVADLISQASRWPVTWFPDANIAFIPQTEVVWEALRMAGLGIRGGVAALTTAVRGEMEEWLNAPFRLKDRANDIKAALDNATWLRTI